MNIIKATQILLASLLWAASMNAFAQVKVVVIPMAEKI